MNRIRALRQEANVKQEELAKHLKVSRASLSGYETGNFEAPVQVYFQLADYFGVTLDYLLGRTDEKSPSLNRDRLDEEEWKALELFMELNAEGRLSALTMLRALADSPAYKKSAVSGQIQEGIG